MKTSTLLAGAAVAGLLSGSIANAATTTTDTKGNSSVRAGQSVGTLADKEKHSCKGQNSCKGKGGCKTDDNSCKGKNACKGKGGCATDGSKK